MCWWGRCWRRQDTRECGLFAGWRLRLIRPTQNQVVTFVGRISASAIRHMQNQAVIFVGRISVSAIRQYGISGR
ncbi:hypothetical protein EDP2_3289 [Enterobacter cloacae S611]|uniref:Uncharacterized protein n=1 Tax=Enterobacter cloacae S611 TaxID=1399146 RepID=A0ABP2ZQ38_ENTCL|nr:hypothetical protein EDP2_3289 [Enterobacter cloacae S611]